MLSDSQVKKLKPREKRYKVLDGAGLYVAVYPSGRKVFVRRFTMMENGRRRDTERVLGEYPTMSLAEARRENSTPFMPKPLTFGELYNEWLKRWSESGVSEKSVERITSVMRIHILPTFGNTPIESFSPRAVLAHLETMSPPQAYRALSVIGRVLRLGVATERAPTDFTHALLQFLKPRNIVHAYTPKTDAEIKAILSKLAGRRWSLSRAVVWFQIYTMTRVSEAIGARWDEINGNVWTIPRERMKMKREHVVPLSRQALAILESMKAIRRDSDFVFPVSSTAHIRYSSIRMYVQRIAREIGGDTSSSTSHSFRSMASTLLHEHGWPHELIETSLAHVEKSAVSRSYNHATYLGKRREMLQWYADYLDALRIE